MARLDWFPEAALAKLDGAVRVGVDRAALTLQEIVKNEKLSGNPLDVRTGTLKRSITYQVAVDGYSARVGTNVVYARAHEFGAVIKPKNAKFLTIPIGQYRVQSRTARIRSARQVKDLVYIPRKNGEFGGMLGRPKGRGKARSIEPLFLLRKRVTIPPRPFLRPALYDNGPRIAAALGEGIRREMRK